MNKNENATVTATTEAALEQAKVSATEASLIAKYGDKIVPGSVHRAPSGSKYGEKMLCKIRTRGLDGEYDGNERTVATSDVFQVHHTEEVAAALRKQRQAEKRAAKSAARKAEKAEQSDKTESEQLADAADALGV